jgi:hypothetical protein
MNFGQEETISFKQALSASLAPYYVANKLRTVP